MKYTNTTISEILYAPNMKLVVTAVSLKESNNYVCTVDLRKHYKSGKDNWYVTKQGLSFNRQIALDISNAICAMPEDIDMTERKYVEICRFKKNDSVDVVLGVGKLYGTYGIDVREFVDDTAHGYKGFSFKGFRIPVDNASDISDGLLKAIEAIDDKQSNKKPCKKVAILRKGRPKKNG